MNKNEVFGAGWLPLIALAGLLSGSMFRPGTRPEHPQADAKVERADQAPAATVPTSRYADMQPVLDLLADSLGISLQPNATARAARALRLDAERAGQSQWPEIAKALAALEQARTKPSSAALTDKDPLAIVDSYLRPDIDPASVLHRLRAQLVDRAFEEAAAADGLRTLTRSLNGNGVHWNVRFFVATIPDYVDSNSGWVADETLGAIQSAMSSAGFLLDRFRLIDWSPAEQGRAGGAAADSRLHERQPGALIFRRVEKDKPVVTLAVVLLVLETPTTGVHRLALRNAMKFVGDWSSSVDPPQTNPTLNVVGPVFSGSVVSLGVELNQGGWPGSVHVVTGSAMADGNASVMQAFAPNVLYESTAARTSDVMTVLAASLGHINSDGRIGRRVAMLVEGNTTFGNDAFGGDSFHDAVVYRFPLHVAQLRNDATSQPAGTISLLPNAIVPLTFHESIPPADQLPALRPQMTSPVVEATMSNLLDAIHHDDITAVGIIATDPRDVLFLAREVKKAAPDVQLFLTGAYALYLHPDYIPYTRGAIVATPYPLALAEQRRLHPSNALEREPFPSMMAAGIFNAMLLQIGRPDRLIDYCNPRQAAGSAPLFPGCRPPLWVSIIGDDGYWPVVASPVPEPNLTPSVLSSPTPGRQRRATTAAILAVAFLTLLAVSLASAVLRSRSNGRFDSHFTAIPLLSVLVMPTTSRGVARLHSLGVIVCGVLLAAIAFWMVAAMVMHAGGPENVSTRRAAAILAVLVSASFVGGCAALVRRQHSDGAPADDGVEPRAAQQRTNQAVMLICFAGIAGAVVCFVRFAVGTLASPDSLQASFDVARFVGGGIVSPAAAVVCLFGAMLAATLSGLRRLSSIGVGYAALAHRSPAFRLLSGAPPAGPGAELSTDPADTRPENRPLQRFVAVLDMPMQNLPEAYLIGVGVLVAAIGWQTGWVSTVDGPWFSRFITLASWSALVAALLLTAQGAIIWNVLKPKLERLSHTPLAGALGRVGHEVRWDFSIQQPRLSELMPAAARAERIRCGLVSLANARLGNRWLFKPDRRAIHAQTLNGATSQGLLVRAGDADQLALTLEGQAAARVLRDEIIARHSAPLLASDAWRRLWRTSDRLVEMLERVHWRRHPLSERPAQVDVWFAECEEFVALQYAFVVRDVLARITSSLFSAMVVLGLLTAAHLFYLFQGRASLLTVDLAAVIVIGLVAINIVVAMERDVIISTLRLTTPGRIDFNWDFVRQVATYGLLPLIAIIASLFPEVGGSIFGWLEPLRKLVAP